jgi:AspT/YidE/YbjL antiporter-like protein
MHPFHWLAESQPIAHALLMLAVVAVTGLALGSLKLRGVGLGSAGVLFAFTIGLQLGPGFVTALRRQGFSLNVLAAAIVGLGVVVTLLGAMLLGLDPAAAAGLLTGTTTNTPSLGAVEQVLGTLNLPADRAALPALAYAVAYPVGIAGIIGSMLLLRSVYAIDLARELERFRSDQQRGTSPIERRNVVVENRNLEGLTVGQIPGRAESGVVVSRVRRRGATEAEPAGESTLLHVGDVVLAVGTPDALTQFVRVVGSVSPEDLMKSPGPVASRRVVVTRKQVLGKSLEELGLKPLPLGVLLATPAIGQQLATGDDTGRLREVVAAQQQELAAQRRMLEQLQELVLRQGRALEALTATMPQSQSSASTPEGASPAPQDPSLMAEPEQQKVNPTQEVAREDVPNLMPDLATRVAFNPTEAVHLDVGGVFRSFRHTLPTYRRDFSQAGGGVSANLGLKPSPTARLILQTAYGAGLGRYVGGLVPDLIVGSNGSIQPVTTFSWVGGLELASSTSTSLAGYHSGVRAGDEVAVDADGTLIGYGYDGAPDSHNRVIQEATGVLTHRLVMSDRGSVQWAPQVSWLQRAPWSARPGLASADAFLFFTQIRYNLP